MQALLTPIFARFDLMDYSDGSSDHPPDSQNGYHFQVLTGQCNVVTGGSLNHLARENVVSGHTLAVVPAANGDFAVHGFVMSKNSIVLEADLGDKALDLAIEIGRSNLGADWQPVD